MNNPSVKINYLLLPFAVIYGMVVRLRNKLFDWGVLRSRVFPLPVICIGNLTVGGTGKTPHTEHVAGVLRDVCRTAVLSRGYGRRTHGFILADGPRPGNQTILRAAVVKIPVCGINALLEIINHAGDTAEAGNFILSQTLVQMDRSHRQSCARIGNNPAQVAQSISQCNSIRSLILKVDVVLLHFLVNVLSQHRRIADRVIAGVVIILIVINGLASAASQHADGHNAGQHQRGNLLEFHNEFFLLMVYKR